jgi:hypothetical protein
MVAQLDKMHHQDEKHTNKQTHQNEARQMNKTEILETIEWALFSEMFREWEAILSGDTETARRYNTSAAGQIKLAHQLLGSRYYHKINELEETVARKAAAAAADRRYQRQTAA